MHPYKREGEKSNNNVKINNKRKQEFGKFTVLGNLATKILDLKSYTISVESVYINLLDHYVNAGC